MKLTEVSIKFNSPKPNQVQLISRVVHQLQCFCLSSRFAWLLLTIPTQLISSCCLASSIKGGVTTNLKVQTMFSFVCAQPHHMFLFMSIFMTVLSLAFGCEQIVFSIIMHELKRPSVPRRARQRIQPAQRVTNLHIWPFLRLGSRDQENRGVRVEGLLRQRELRHLSQVSAPSCSLVGRE